MTKSLLALYKKTVFFLLHVFAVYVVGEGRIDSCFMASGWFFFSAFMFGKLLMKLHVEDIELD